jgi:hypothetical protein
MLYARYELSYDSFFEHGDRIFRLRQYLPDCKFGGFNYFVSTSGIVASTLKEEFPEVASAVRTKDVKLSETRAKKLFGGEAPLSQTVKAVIANPAESLKRE